MNISIYIKNRKLDLFEDETVELTSKLSDIEKLSNIFMDFTQSFTIPATANNSEVFNHYYDMDIDNTFNANIREEAYIELNTIPFRLGVIQLESVTVKDGRPDNYKITFYGGVKQITDLFGDDTIDRLDYVTDEFGVETKEYDSLSQFDYDYNAGNWIDSIANPEFMDGEIITPLINYSDRDWIMGGSDNSKDITVDAGAIYSEEVRPAIRLINILKAIEVKYGITFSRDFFNLAVFNNLFMWMNAKQETLIDEEFELIPQNAFTGTNDGSFTMGADGFIEIERRAFHGSGENFRTRAIVTITSPDPLAKYNLKLVTRSGNVLKEWNNLTGTQTKGWETRSTRKFDDLSMTTDTYKFIVTTPRSTVFSDVDFFVRNIVIDPSQVDTVNSTSLNNTYATDVKILIHKQLAKMKVSDFLGGIMKIFKLVIRPITSTSFYVDTMDSFYNKGNLIDITDYTDIESVVYTRPLIYKNLEFKYADNETANQVGYKEANGEFWGNLKAKYNEIQNTDELKVELPFTTLLWERLSKVDSLNVEEYLSSLMIGRSQTKELSKTDIGNLLFFNLSTQKSDTPLKYKWEDELATSVLSYYNLCGTIDDLNIDQITQSLAWGAENDPYLLTRIDNSLYLNYWSNWINTIYDLKQRKVTAKATLPPRFIEELSLNDRIIIGSNRFKISDYKTNLTTGETNFNLFKDIYSFNAPPPKVSTTSIIATAGTKFYTVFINGVESEWLANVEYLGVEEDWIEFITPTQGEDNGYITFKILPKAGQTPPLVFESRVATLTVEVDGVDYPITITQGGID